MARALLLNEVEKKVSASIVDIDEADFPDGDLEIDVMYSTLNYKDGMIINGIGRLVRSYPHVPGVDMVGVVRSSSNDQFSVGDLVLATGWRIGESFWGGYSTFARVNSDFCIKLPQNLSPATAMSLGTAGISAMQGIIALEDHGLSDMRELGSVLVTGSAGGVGSVAIIALSALGYRVTASTRRVQESEYLTSLGATEVIASSEVSGDLTRPLESERWIGAIENVGGDTLGRLVSQMVTGASIASIGLAAGAVFTANVMPFLLRGVNILGIDSVKYPNAKRSVAWERLGELVPSEKIASMTQIVTLDDLIPLANQILAGGVRGRVVVDVNG
ncbi:MAG: oxidoreductase [Actinomycetota bacterium]|nr:oxidoreductase [Actinomycetota bacterium]